MDVNGGPIETPSMRRIAERGVTFGNFHTTALCSPTRSSLLNGRNATSNGMACIAEATTGFPGSNGRIPFENGKIAEVLGERGWNTYCVGKWHLTPEEEMDASSWKKRWPLGRGFDRYYGFLGGETSQWYPDLVHDNHPVEPPASPEDGYHLSKDLADRAIEFVATQAAAPDKPFFLSFAPGCGHAPTTCRPSGPTATGSVRSGLRGDPGRDRGEPEGTGPAARAHHAFLHQPARRARGHRPGGQPWPQPDWVKPWESLSDDERQLFARMAEVDRDSSRTPTTTSGESSTTSKRPVSSTTRSSWPSRTTVPAPRADRTDRSTRTRSSTAWRTPWRKTRSARQLGTPTSYNHYCSGWAWAFDTPFPYWKRFAGYEGGTADLCVLSWPEGIRARVVRGQYAHAVDITPTLYDLLGVAPPPIINGHAQSRSREELRCGTRRRGAPGPSTQFSSMLGQRAMYRDGWIATAAHPPATSNWGSFDQDVWELYHLDADRSQSTNVAADHPELLAELISLWRTEADRLNGLPLDDRTAVELLTTPRPQPSPPRDRSRYRPGISTVPEAVAVNLRGRSFTIAAAVEIHDDAPSGTLMSFGGLLGGLILYLRGGELCFTYSWLGEDIQTVRGAARLDHGRHLLTAEFAVAGPTPPPRARSGR